MSTGQRRSTTTRRSGSSRGAKWMHRDLKRAIAATQPLPSQGAGGVPTIEIVFATASDQEHTAAARRLRAPQGMSCIYKDSDNTLIGCFGATGCAVVPVRSASDVLAATTRFPDALLVRCVLGSIYNSPAANERRLSRYARGEALHHGDVMVARSVATAKQCVACAAGAVEAVMFASQSFDYRRGDGTKVRVAEGVLALAKDRASAPSGSDALHDQLSYEFLAAGLAEAREAIVLVGVTGVDGRVVQSAAAFAYAACVATIEALVPGGRVVAASQGSRRSGGSSRLLRGSRPNSRPGSVRVATPAAVDVAAAAAAAADKATAATTADFPAGSAASPATSRKQGGVEVPKRPWGKRYEGEMRGVGQQPREDFLPIEFDGFFDISTMKPVPSHGRYELRAAGTVDQVFEYVFADECVGFWYIRKVYGDDQVYISDWAPLGQDKQHPDVMTRCLSLTSHTPDVTFGPKVTRTRQRQYYHMSEDHRHLIWQYKATSPDVPYGNAFTVFSRMDVVADDDAPADAPRVTVKLWYSTEWSSKPLIRRVIEKIILEQAILSAEDIDRFITEFPRFEDAPEPAWKTKQRAKAANKS